MGYQVVQVKFSRYRNLEQYGMFEFNRIQLYSGSGLDRIHLYSGSGLDSIQLYSGSGLDRIYLTLCILYFYPFYPLANEVAREYSNATVRPSVRPSFRNILVNTRISILQWILTKLGTYLVLKRICNPIDFQGQRSRSPGQIFTM